MSQPTHKNLQSTFAAPPPRGRKLQGLLKSPDRRQPAAASSEPGQQDPASPTSTITQSPARQADAPSPDPTVAATPQQQPAAAPTPEATNKVAGQSTPAGPAVPRALKSPSAEIGPTSVYLHTKAYRELVDRRQKKFRSYAQTVYDAFAFIRDKANDQNQDPADALAKLFDVNDAADPWLMPEPRSARNSSEPTVEAKIALKPQERQWVKDKMADIGATHLSPFLATVLEHFLLHAKT
ncbi:hypothetical protein [Mycobacterium paragordonae]|uniref:hypothetical protein n=1 Tax=Mycobacterium paragordonae TaxID=1389713 RepID=UPI0010619D8A|nr:hypothetical protein [Mycobacterium paragordonae]TDL02934.1 hypothetical protein EUA05_25915 [Mycobacterium paragordonae]